MDYDVLRVQSYVSEPIFHLSTKNGLQMLVVQLGEIAVNEALSFFQGFVVGFRQ